MKMNSISRRDFLKLSSAGFLSLGLLGYPPINEFSDQPVFQGRVVYNNLLLRDAPNFKGLKVNSFKRDSILEITEKVFGGSDGDYNRIWYRLENGYYVYSGYVQTVETKLNDLIMDISTGGILGEITIPYADSQWGINRNPYPGPRLYYGSTHWILDMVIDRRDGSMHYKAYDEAKDYYYYIPTHWVHLFSQQEISPLSPMVPESEKHIEIYLHRQLLIAYEWNQPVYAARISTGQRNYESPPGSHRVIHKRPTYHMEGGADEFSVFDLPGVPWDTYITESGVAIHGTYWHNDFGHPHSHGCINLPPLDAKWIYRWTTPPVPQGKNVINEPDAGTRVEIFAH
jgi:hypothetical protein